MSRVDIEATVTAAIEATQSAGAETSASAPTAVPISAKSAQGLDPDPTPEPLQEPIAIPLASLLPTATPAPLPTPTASPTTGYPIENSIVVTSPSVIATPTPESRTEMLARVKEAVVRISTDIGVGSGVIVEVDESGDTAYVLTNYQVVDDGSPINVVVGSSETLQGSIVGFDALRDLAVVQICCGTDFSSLAFADPEAVRLTDNILSLGYLPENLSDSALLADGIVTGLIYDADLDRREFQVDAAIEPGFSGGPLLSDAGEIAGINSYVVLPVPGPGPVGGTGFAVSTDDLEDQYRSLRSGQTVTAPAPSADPRFPSGIYTSPNGGWQINVPDGWRLDESTGSMVDIWDGSNQATIRVSLIAVDPILYPDALFFREEWTVSPAPDWSDYKIVSESIDIFRTKVSSSKTARGHEFQATFKYDDQEWLETTHWFVTDGTRYSVSLLAPSYVRQLTEFSAFDVDLRIAFTSFRPL
ncbi:MAG: trypsin-like peptidase domain-containing protein [Chloroflexi bacterium]|nr:trypsin-like peptidase domain-containing protein [Chloroflexota bacterium]